MNKLFLLGFTVLGLTFATLPTAVQAQLMLSDNAVNSDTDEVVVNALESEAQDARTDLQGTGTDIKETLENQAVDAKSDLKETGIGIKDTLEATGYDIKDTLRGTGEVPYRNLRDFFVGD